jgi:hypothetical protein
MPCATFYYVVDTRTGLYHAGSSYGGRWGNFPQFFSRRRDAEYRVGTIHQWYPDAHLEIREALLAWK